MCARLVVPDRAEAEGELTVSRPWWTFTTRFNVAPTHSVPVARSHGGELEGVMMRWGLVPAETRKTEFGPGKPFIPRALIDEAELRSIWMHGQRGIVPLAGFYVWHHSAAGYRQPFYVRLVARPVFGVAVLWDRFTTEDDDVIEGCGLITVPANRLLTEIGTIGSTMPAILRREAYSSWLEGPPGPARELLEPYPAERMVGHAVSPRVNFSQFDDAGLIRRIE
ncbi:MAG: SOS response-associated peptidase family protein [Sinobacteraceae bacterium]|nr:SOS response-associated peptidase family protein [Nevskiaceae bacterium]